MMRAMELEEQKFWSDIQRRLRELELEDKQRKEKYDVREKV